MMDILQLEGVSKHFGSLQVLREVTFSVPEGSIFGLIGKNGAGKTTLMKLVLGFLRADAGEIRVCGEPVRYGNARTNRLIGYLPDVPAFYGYMTPVEYLRFCGQIAGMPPARIREHSKELLELVGLGSVNRKIRGFSRGMKQRLGIAQALLGESHLLICDEPTSALDPVGRKEILDILSLAGKQTAVLFSTHVLSDVERICDRIAVLDDGKIALQGPLEEIRGCHRQDAVRIQLFDAPPDGFFDLFRQMPFVSAVSAEEDTVTLRLADAKQDGANVLNFLLREQLHILKYEVLEPTLEDVFMEAVQ